MPSSTPVANGTAERPASSSTRSRTAGSLSGEPKCGPPGCDHSRVDASGSLAERHGQREVRLRLGEVNAAAEARLAAAGSLHRCGDEFTVALTGEDDGTTVPGLVADLVAQGAQVHAVEPGRISLEERLLGFLW